MSEYNFDYLYHVVAASGEAVIGKGNQLPWKSSADLKHFKKITMGGTVIMGRKTFDSIGGEPLPGRKNYVITRSNPLPSESENLKFFNSIEEALKHVKTLKVFIIGGGEIFKQTMDKVDHIALTLIKGDFEGDTYYPVAPLIQGLVERGFKVITRDPCPDDPRLEFIELKKESKCI